MVVVVCGMTFCKGNSFNSCSSAIVISVQYMVKVVIKSNGGGDDGGGVIGGDGGGQEKNKNNQL